MGHMERTANIRSLPRPENCTGGASKDIDPCDSVDLREPDAAAVPMGLYIFQEKASNSSAFGHQVFYCKAKSFLHEEPPCGSITRGKQTPHHTTPQSPQSSPIACFNSLWISIRLGIICRNAYISVVSFFLMPKGKDKLYWATGHSLKKDPLPCPLKVC